MSINTPCTGLPDCVCDACLRACLGRFVPSLLRYLRRHLNDEDDVADALSDAFRAALGWISSGEAALMTSAQRRGRLCKAARFMGLNAAAKRKRGVLGKAAPLPDDIWNDADPASPLMIEDDKVVLAEALDDLATEERELLEMHFIRGESYASIAMQRGWSKTGTKRHLDAVLGSLRRRLGV